MTPTPIPMWQATIEQGYVEMMRGRTSNEIELEHRRIQSAIQLQLNRLYQIQGMPDYHILARPRAARHWPQWVDDAIEDGLFPAITKNEWSNLI